jgi:hypothetical protein
MIAIADHLLGRMIRCPYCQEPARVPNRPTPGGPRRGAPTRIRRTQLPPLEQSEPVTRLDRYDDDDGFEQPPRRGRRPTPEPDYDEPPEEILDDVEQDEVPLPRRAKKKGGGGFLIIILLLLVLLVGGGGAAVYFLKPEWLQEVPYLKDLVDAPAPAAPE